jgi:8-oxo-dGTP pyrophosphatase MutT (NUDIX family)
MFEPILKSSYYFNENNSKAFNSLSFRGKKGYSMNLVNKYCKRDKTKYFKQKTYGAILCIKEESGITSYLYALVQGSYTGKWSFPKGHSNVGEKPLECTLREVGEETGIDKLPEASEYLQIGYGNYFVFYLSEPIKLIPRDTHEIMDTKWVTLKEMESMVLNADVSIFMKKMKENL